MIDGPRLLGGYTYGSSHPLADITAAVPQIVSKSTFDCLYYIILNSSEDDFKVHVFAVTIGRTAAAAAQDKTICCVLRVSIEKQQKEEMKQPLMCLKRALFTRGGFALPQYN